MSLVPVVMAGGSGTRLWPLSRELYPKQFLSLVGNQTMLQETCGRLTLYPKGRLKMGVLRIQPYFARR